MATLGPFTLFDVAIAKFMDAAGPINLTGGSIKAILTTSAQTMSRSFVGSSNDGRYSDITAELTTAGGYTSGGLLFSGLSVTTSSGVGHWAASPWSWTITSLITFKYLVIYDNSAPNKDLLCFCDMDITGPSINVNPGLLQFVPDSSGIFKWTQP